MQARPNAWHEGLWAAAALLSPACNDPSSAVPRTPTYEVDAGDYVVLEATVRGVLKEAQWKIVSAKACEGTIEEPQAGSATARFLAPKECDRPEAENKVEMTVKFDSGQEVRTTVTVLVRGRAPRAPDAPSSAPPPPARASSLFAVAPQLGGESYFDFHDVGFVATHRLESDHLAITLAARGGKFGGTCVVHDDGPMDVSVFSSLEVDIEPSNPRDGIEVKLEATDSSRQHYLHDGPMEHEGRSTLRLPLAGTPQGIAKGLRRICFATNDAKLLGAAEDHLKVYGIRFK